MVTMSASISGAEMSGLQSALLKYGEALGGNMRTATRVTALALCDSLRARTKKAPKKAPRSEYEIAAASRPPHYITYKNGKKLAKPLHRWNLTRKLGTPDQYSHDYFVYCHSKTTKRGKVVTDTASEQRELKQYHLGIARAGLAKQSWGWMKKDIAGHGSDVTWKKRKGDKRNPRDSVRGEFEAIKRVLSEDATARLKNHLDYVEDALKAGALTEAIEAATKSIAWKILQLEAKL